MAATSTTPTTTALALLAARATAGAMMLTQHGWPKLTSYSEKAPTFPDPLGVGHSASMALAVFAELGCSALVVLGLFTRVAAAQLVFTMGVAALVIHRTDPFAKKELALVYGALFLVALLAGGGRFSLDERVRPRLPRWLAKIV